MSFTAAITKFYCKNQMLPVIAKFPIDKAKTLIAAINAIVLRADPFFYRPC